jgi:hypothetical protein
MVDKYGLLGGFMPNFTTRKILSSRHLSLKAKPRHQNEEIASKTISFSSLQLYDSSLV